VKAPSPALVRWAGLAERTVSGLGSAVSWLSLAMVLATAAVVILRYFFDAGWIWMQETVTWMHAAVFMLAAGYTLALDEHVRVDIFYRKLSGRGRLFVDVFGVALLLLPTCLMILVNAWDYVAGSWAIGESSPEAGGLPGLFLLKTLIVVTPVLLILEGIAFVVRRWLQLATGEDGERPADEPGSV